MTWITMESRRTVEGSAFTRCPVCGTSVALALAETHIDLCLRNGKGKERKAGKRKQGGGISLGESTGNAFVGFSGAPRKKPKALDLGDLAPHPLLSGQFIWKDFLTEEEEASLVTYLDAGRPPWVERNFNGLARHKNWGYEVDLRRRTVGQPKHPMPPIFETICERMAGPGGGEILSAFSPDEANAISYHRNRGHSLEPHVDDRQLNGDILCNLCLLGDASMTYTKEKPKPTDAGPTTVNVKLLRRSLQGE